MWQNSTTDEFVVKARKIHGDCFDYSFVEYVANDLNVIISCPKHGKFNQLPSNHLLGKGCRKCSCNIPDKFEFVTKANKIHSNFYNYCEFVYTNNKTKGIIICPKHGKFLQSPNNHLRGKGCLPCGRAKSFQILTSTSKPELEFLNCVGINLENRQKFIKGYFVDGYDPKTNTIYEFLGDYWHGNPVKFDSDKINKPLNKTFGELYYKTFRRFIHLKNYGYNLKYIWQSDWNKFKRGIDKIPFIICH